MAWRLSLSAARVRWGLALAVLAVVAGGALVPGSAPAAGAVLARDAVAHAVGFGAVAVGFAFALERPQRPGPSRSPAAVLGGAFLLAVAAGGGVELLQPEVGRTASWGDLGADAAGAAVACSLYRLATR
ncbi:MAG: hypothetical protein ABEJ42_02800 [Halobacteriaceae archaeon]